MNDLIISLIESGVIDAATGELLQSQLDSEFARNSAEQRLLAAVLNGLQEQQAQILSGVDVGITTIDEASALFDVTESILADAMLPTVNTIASERAISQAVSISVGLGEAALEATFNTVNESVLQWAGDYYLSLEDDDKGSVPNLNRTSRSRFLTVFEQWNRGELPVQQAGQGEGLPDLIDALESTFGPSRAEGIGTTEVTRIFAESTFNAGRASEIVVGFGRKTARDERVCPICRPLHDVIIPVSESKWVHPDPQIGEIGLPSHTRCRCDVFMVTELIMQMQGLTFR